MTESTDRIDRPNRPTESTDRIDRPNRSTESTDRIDRPNRSTESTDRIDRPDRSTESIDRIDRPDRSTDGDRRDAAWNKTKKIWARFTHTNYFGHKKKTGSLFRERRRKQLRFWSVFRKHRTKLEKH